MASYTLADKILLMSDSELRDFIKYTPEGETKNIALGEASKRGMQLRSSESASSPPTQPISVVEQKQSLPSQAFGRRDPWGKAQHVNDENAPLLYSKRAIYSFSVFFSVVFGAIMMVMNMRELKKPEGVVPTVTFSIGYLAAVICVTNYLSTRYEHDLSSSNLIALLGGALLNKMIWDKYIGDSVMYRKRGILIPTIVGIVCLGLFLIVYFSAHQA